MINDIYKWKETQTRWTFNNDKVQNDKEKL